MSQQQLLAVLQAYNTVVQASWPDLHPRMASRSRIWPALPEAELREELARYVKESDKPGCNVRVFWKIGYDLRYEGCNRQFANDAGFLDEADLLGLTDLDDRMSWTAQAAKYRKDDREVIESGKSKLDIIERQNSAVGTVWLRTGKAPIRMGDQAIGVLGMYEVIDASTVAKLSRMQKGRG